MPTLEFKGKPFVYSHHLSVPFRELIVDRKKSYPVGKRAIPDDNLIIHGDNLEALKALLPRYAGKVDVVYIDPPYNTGNKDWAYNDNVNSPLMKEWLGKVVDRDDLERHDKWLCMMWPRLQLLWELLSTDGVLAISIDDHEYHRLRQIVEEIVGEEHVIGEVAWKTRNSDNRVKSKLSTDHEYVLFCSKGAPLMGRKIDRSDFKNPDDDPRGAWVSDPLTGKATAEERPNLHYVMVNPSTKDRWDPDPSRGWITDESGFKKLLKDKRIWWPPDSKTGKPRKKRFLSETAERMPEGSFWSDLRGQSGADELDQIMGRRVFAFPKSLEFMCRVLDLVGKEDALILDSFAGSGSTGHATLALNKSDGGSRKFILVETEGYADKLTAERIRRVIKGLPKAQDPALKMGLGGSFTYCELGEPIDLDRFFSGKGAPSYEQVARYVVYTGTGHSAPDVQKEPRKDWFVTKVGGYRIHLIYKPDLAFMRSNDAALSMPLAEKIAKAAKGKPVLVYAAAKFMAQAELGRKGITFCQLPYSVHRVLGEAPHAP